MGSRARHSVLVGRGDAARGAFLSRRFAPGPSRGAPRPSRGAPRPGKLARAARVPVSDTRGPGLDHQGCRPRPPRFPGSRRRILRFFGGGPTQERAVPSLADPVPSLRHLLFQVEPVPSERGNLVPEPGTPGGRGGEPLRGAGERRQSKNEAWCTRRGHRGLTPAGAASVPGTTAG